MKRPPETLAEVASCFLLLTVKERPSSSGAGNITFHLEKPSDGNGKISTALNGA